MSNRISPIKVMKSNAGWYVGKSFTEFIEDDNGTVIDTYQVPYSRLSRYFPTNAACADFLKDLLYSSTPVGQYAN